MPRQLLECGVTTSDLLNDHADESVEEQGCVCERGRQGHAAEIPKRDTPPKPWPRTYFRMKRQCREEEHKGCEGHDDAEPHRKRRYPLCNDEHMKTENTEQDAEAEKVHGLVRPQLRWSDDPGRRYFHAAAGTSLR